MKLIRVPQATDGLLGADENKSVKKTYCKQLLHYSEVQYLDMSGKLQMCFTVKKENGIRK